MPEPIGRGQRYIPALDGLRALAVMAVVADHLGLSWAPGGMLGVGVFFTLSGYLITDLLLGHWEATGRLKLGDFWLRRARRLLPALFSMLVVVTGWVALADRSGLQVLRGEVVASALYVSNWWAIFDHLSYFARFAPPSPLGHLWSLAVEEQFYLVWPLLLWAGLAWDKRRRGAAAGNSLPRGPRRHWALAGATLVLASLSAAEMGLLYHPSFDPTRVYDGTDTRAFALLAGAALAMVWPSRGLRAGVAAGARRLIDGAGIAALAVIVLLIWRTNQYSSFLYRGGMALLAVAAMVAVAVAVHPASRVAKGLGWRPLRWIGVRSYGIYLWHFPVIVLTTPTVTKGSDLVRDTLQVGASVGLAALSWRFIESPIRHGALGRIAAQVRSYHRARRGVPARGWLALSAAAAGLGVGLVGLAGVVPSAPAGTLTALVQPTKPAPVEAKSGSAGASTTSPREKISDSSTTLTTLSVPTAPKGGGARRGRSADSGRLAPSSHHSARLATSCTSVVHIGDSTSESLVSSAYLPDPVQRLDAQYRRVGVVHSIMEIQGATSVVETLPGERNAYEVAQGLVTQGYRGCWVIALGTNDTADVYVGSNVSLATRVGRMMSVIGHHPVMWVNAISLLGSGPYSEANMQLWNQALVEACKRYPNMRVFDWAAMAEPKWFISDGIHYSSAGSAVRAAAIANALARAFPASEKPGAPHLSCVVG